MNDIADQFDDLNSQPNNGRPDHSKEHNTKQSGIQFVQHGILLFEWVIDMGMGFIIPHVFDAKKKKKPRLNYY